MKIKDGHMYHGAALTRIAEHPQFTAINVFKLSSGISRSAFKINDEIGVYLKYATTPKGSYEEYPFNFRIENLRELKEIAQKTGRVYLALVCVEDGEICCLSYDQLKELLNRRREANGSVEEQYVVLASLKPGKSFRVYISVPGKKNTLLGNPFVISRNCFPGMLFE